MFLGITNYELRITNWEENKKLQVFFLNTMQENALKFQTLDVKLKIILFEFPHL